MDVKMFAQNHDISGILIVYFRNMTFQYLFLTRFNDDVFLFIRNQ